MATLNNKQVQILKQKGLTDDEIISYAKKYGVKIDSRSGLQKVTEGVNKLFAGGVVGEAIGTGFARRKIGKEFGQEAKQFVEKGPSASQVAGDIALGATQILGAKLPISGGSVASRIGKSAIVSQAQGTATALADNRGVPESIGQGIGSGITGAGFQGAIELINPLGRFLGGVLKRTGSAATGKSIGLIDEVLKDPKTAKGAVGKDALAVRKENAMQVRNAMNTVRQEATNFWDKSVDTIAEKYTGTRIGFSPSDSKNVTKVLGILGVELPQNLSSLSAKESSQLISRINESSILTGTESIADRTLKVNAQKIAKNLKDKAINAFGGKGGEFDNLYQEYAPRKQFLDRLELEFGKIGKVTDAKKYKQTLTGISKIFNKSGALAKEILDSLPGTQGVATKEAAVKLATETGSPQNKNIATLAFQTAIGQKRLAKLIINAGIAREKAIPIVKVLRNLQPAERTVLIQLLSANNSD